MHQVSSRLSKAGLFGYAGFRARSHGFVAAMADPRSPIRHPTRSFQSPSSIRVCRKRLPLLPNRGREARAR